MATKQAYVVVFEGFADWEPAYILPELHRSEAYDVVTVGYAERHVTSMGGLAVTADITFDQMDPNKAGLLLFPGGVLWERDDDERAGCAVKRFHQEGIPVAAICGATLIMARTALLDTIPHTSNSLEFVKQHVPKYVGSEQYVNEPAVSAEGIITASGAGAVEFAREIMSVLALMSRPEIDQWFSLFKYGELPTH